MKQPRINRRQFFKLSAFGASAVAASSLVSVATAPTQEAQAATVEPHKLAIPQPTFNPIASTTVFGPPTDISAGWDGTLWAIDASGAAHLYDPLADQWNPYGDGIEAATAIGNTLYVFRGGQYVTVDLTTKTVTSGPTSVAATWPSLPDSFKLRLTGAADVNGKLVLFNGGWYVYADGSQPRAKLTDITGWPQTANWADGVIDAVYLDQIGSQRYVHLIRGDEYINVSFEFFVKPSVIVGPTPIKELLPSSLATTSIDAATYYPTTGDTFFFHGTSVVVEPYLSNTTTTHYIPKLFAQWPDAWHPVLNHAPSGRMGNLWASAVGGRVLQHDGESWIATPGVGPSTSVGQDSSVYVIGTDGGLFRWDGKQFNPQGDLAPLTQVSVGDDGHVWVRDSNNAVHRYQGNNTFTPVNLGVGVPAPTHMAANADGTLWHCNAAEPSAYRLISDAAIPTTSTPIQVQGGGLVTGVSKVASTGFGAALCLAARNGGGTQVYSYDSPYLFKTAANYAMLGTSSGVEFAQGLGALYFVQRIAYSGPPFPLSVRFVAMDQHTGREVASYSPTPSPTTYTGVVFDPINELVYVGTSPYYPTAGDFDQTTPGQLIALDARTLAVKWTFTADAGIDAVPLLNGTQLCFGDRRGNLYAIDTRAALAGAPSTPTAQWKIALSVRQAQTHRVTTPLYANGVIYVGFWDVSLTCDGCINGSQFSWATVKPDGTALSPAYILEQFYVTDVLPGMIQSPLLGQAKFALGHGTSAVQQCLFVNATSQVYAVSLVDPDPNQPKLTAFTVPSGTVVTGFAYDDGSRAGSGLTGQPPGPTRLWFGDSNGNLWGLDENMKAVDGTPLRVDARTSLQLFQVATPVLYKDPQGGLTVLFGVLDLTLTSAPGLWGYDPSSRNIASVATGVTYINTLSPAVTNGVIWAGGASSVDSPSQMFGIRVDKLPQGLRDFVIESQMMQDPDPYSPNSDPANNVPPSFARYQTHLTVVDDQKYPQIYEPVKIWCDKPNTKITVDGQSFTVGPDGASYASVKTGLDGALVLTMDAADYFAPTLRVWASFMDPYERIVVNPDAEFHRRVMTAHANAGDDDPDKVNLQTATNYKGASLFTADEKNQNPSQPQNIANSIQKVNAGLGLSSGNSKGMYRKLMRAMGVKHKNQRISVQWIEDSPPSREGLGVGSPSPSLSLQGEEATPPDKYMAYADLPGATHFPTNVPSQRLASIVQPVGLSFSRPNGDATKAPTFTALSHADARAAIDELKGEAWKPNDLQGGNASRITLTHALNIWQDFWNWLKGLLDKVLQCILSIGEDILAGIQYFVGQALKVFKAIIKVLDDVFPFLGSFFKMLEKLVDDVVEALSVLFNFGEIIKTHTFLRGELLGRMQQIKSTVTSQIVPAVDSFFKEGEAAIVGFFNQLRGQLAPSQSFNSLHGMGSTAHSAYRVKTADGGTSSQAVQSSWATQKLKTGLRSALGGTFATNARPTSADDDPIADFISAFLNRITGDGDLSAAFGQLRSDIRSLLHPSSAAQFFSTLFMTLLDILETLLVGVLAVGNALADGLLAVVGDVIDTLFDPHNGLLVAQLDVPILSWLYQQLFGEPLTFVNAILLVAAIPVTMIYRVGFGRYPSQDLTLASALGTDPVKVIGIVVGLFSGIGTMVGGVVNMLAALDQKAPPILGKVSLAISGLLAASSFPIADIKKPDAYDLAEFGLGLVGLGLGLIGLKTFEEATQQLLDVLMPFLNSVNNIGLLVLYSVQAAKQGISNGWQFAAGVISTLPGLLDPLRLIEDVGEIILAVVVGVAGFAVGTLDLVAALTSINAPEQRPYRLHFPFVPHSPQPVAAHP